VWTTATRQLVMEWGLSGRLTECRYCRYPAPKGRCHGNHFLASKGYNFGCVIASDSLFDSRGWVFGVKLSDEDIADFEVLRDVAMATIFWLFIYGLHIGATWRMRLNRACAAAMRPYAKLLWQLVIPWGQYIICYISMKFATWGQHLDVRQLLFGWFHQNATPCWSLLSVIVLLLMLQSC